MSDQDTPQMPGSSEPLLGRSLPKSVNCSREGSISSPNIFATSAASGITIVINPVLCLAMPGLIYIPTSDMVVIVTS